MSEGLLVTIDPGLHGCGVALFRDGQLENAGYVEARSDVEKRAEAWLAMAAAVRVFVGARRVSQFVVELPQVYVAARMKGDPNDLIQLAAVVGALCVVFETAEKKVFLPAEWKRQVPKEIVHSRAKARLTEEECKTISSRRKSLLHNVWDAVAIGLVFLGRL